WQCGQKVQTATNDEVEKPEGIRSNQIQVAREIVIIFWLSEFAQTRPPQAECQDSVFCKGNAALLLVFGQIAQRFVTGQIEKCGHASANLLGFIQNRCRQKARQNLVAILAHTVSMIGCNDAG